LLLLLLLMPMIRWLIIEDGGNFQNSYKRCPLPAHALCSRRHLAACMYPWIVVHLIRACSRPRPQCAAAAAYYHLAAQLASQACPAAQQLSELEGPFDSRLNPDTERDLDWIRLD
jgi:hypothetical protein